MKTIALTGANDLSLARVAELLIGASRAGGIELCVHVGVNTGAEYAQIHQEAPECELWRVGAGRPELDHLVDRRLDNGTPEDLAIATSRALSQFVNKTRVAA